jgi:hypothetical protein
MYRNWSAAAALLIGVLVLACGCDMKKRITAPVVGGSGSLVVNEFLASNSSFGMDEFSEHDDWIEIYNGSSRAINLAGYRVTDNLGDHQKFVIPSDSPLVTTIQPHGFLMIWCDGQPDQGPLHTPFKLSASGEDIGFYDATGEALTELTFPPQNTDVSYGRTTDGGGAWATFATPTPNASNTGGGASTGPAISGVTLSPLAPTAGASVTVNATITDDGSVASAAVHYAVGAGAFTAVAMTHVGDTWSGIIPAQSAGTTVHYYLSAVDDDDNATLLPTTSPTTTLSYTIPSGSIPVLYINEFLASNAAGMTDPNGEFDDWIEIYNPGSTPVDLGGMYVTDDLLVKNKWQIPATDPTASTVPAHGYLILWADSQPEQGVTHVFFKLSNAGESIGLYTAASETINEVTFGAQTADVSSARVPDGSATWVPLTTPTPGATNGTTTRQLP